jgi:hypothetical protein
MELQMLNLRILTCGLAIGATSLVAVAQNSNDQPASKQPAGQPGDRPNRGGGNGGARGGFGGMMGEPLSADKAKAAWDLEAAGVAGRLGLNADQTKALQKAYGDARTSQQAVMEKLRQDQQAKMKDMDPEDRRDAMQSARKAMEDANKSERDKLTKAVTAAVPGDKGTQAATALGSFNPQWDRMVDTIGGFKLDAAKQQDALNAIETFSAAQTKTLQGAGPDSDRQAMREEMQAAREKLTASLKKDLTDDQLKKFEETMPGMRGGQGGGGGRGRGQGGGGGGDK